MSPVRTRPGPTSTKIRTPAAYIASICSTNRTGWATWPARVCRTASAVSGYGCAVMFDQTGTDGGVTVTLSRSAANIPAAAATTGLWNAHATGIRLMVRPSAARSCAAASTAGVGPEITVCSGAL